MKFECREYGKPGFESREGASVTIFDKVWANF